MSKVEKIRYLVNVNDPVDVVYIERRGKINYSVYGKNGFYVNKKTLRCKDNPKIQYRVATELDLIYRDQLEIKAILEWWHVYIIQIQESIKTLKEGIGTGIYTRFDGNHIASNLIHTLRSVQQYLEDLKRDEEQAKKYETEVKENEK